ncbi:MAG: aminoacyl-tRNA hydrolase [Planctomycetes bacterium]|nr:aminoacyl-tRNA hydrolase [Planctomycetota bacterium]
MKLVVGIGNPGEEYAGTRHNVGFDVVDRVAARNSCVLSHDKRLDARVGRCTIGGEDVVLLEPLSYVNLSGPVAVRVARERDIAVKDVLVVADDYNLPLGMLRVRESGASGGHNGLRSLIGAFVSEGFSRLRVGIGEAPPGGATEFVLSRFRPSERPVMDAAMDRSADCVEEWVRSGPSKAMNKFNG